MTSGYKAAGVDFDDLFDLYVQGTVTASGYKLNGTDLSNRYAPLSYGTKRSNVGYMVNGTDVTNLWATKGSASYSLPFNGKDYYANAAATTGSTGTTTASRSITLASDGTWTVGGTGTLSNTSGAAVSGTWLPSGGSVSNYQVQYVVSASFSSYAAGGSTGNSASSYAALTSSQTASITGAVTANSANECIGVATITVNLKNVSTGVVTTSTIYLHVDAVGWQ